MKKRHRAHSYRGENTAYGLIIWLNEVQDIKARKQIVRMLNLAKRLDEIDNRKRQHISLGYFRNGKLPRASPAEIKVGRERQRLARRLNSILREYTSYPVFHSSRGHKWRLSIKTLGRPRRNPKIYLHLYGDDVPYTQRSAIAQIVKLGTDGLLAKIIKCSECSKWIFARFKHKKFCSVSCQQAAARKSPTFKEGRRLYMRKHRQELKEMKRRQDEARKLS